MSFALAIQQTIEGVVGVVSTDHMTDDEVQAVVDTLRDTLRAVDDELLNRLVARTSRLPVSYPWPGTSGGDPA